jgi:hypothetical protein
MLFIVYITDCVIPRYLTVLRFDTLGRYETIFPVWGCCDWYRSRLCSRFWVRNLVDSFLGLQAEKNVLSCHLFVEVPTGYFGNTLLRQRAPSWDKFLRNIDVQNIVIRAVFDSHPDKWEACSGYADEWVSVPADWGRYSGLCENITAIHIGASHNITTLRQFTFPCVATRKINKH